MRPLAPSTSPAAREAAQRTKLTSLAAEAAQLELELQCVLADLFVGPKLIERPS